MLAMFKVYWEIGHPSPWSSVNRPLCYNRGLLYMRSWMVGGLGTENQRRNSKNFSKSNLRDLVDWVLKVSTGQRQRWLELVGLCDQEELGPITGAREHKGAAPGRGWKHNESNLDHLRFQVSVGQACFIFSKNKRALGVII